MNNNDRVVLLARIDEAIRTLEAAKSILEEAVTAQDGGNGIGGNGNGPPG